MNSDATPAYRGYRLQGLYVLSRLLRDVDSTLSFQPEGLEDLVVVSNTGEIQEVVQVKARSDNLSLSSFSPEKDESFFDRVIALLDTNPESRITVATFGSVGPELQHALNGIDGARGRVAKKLSEYGRISIEQAIQVLSRIHLQQVAEIELNEEVRSRLNSSLVGVDPDAALDLLTAWIYACSEQKLVVSHRHLIEKVNAVGKFLSERAAHHQEWFTTIVPLAAQNEAAVDELDRDRLETEFYQGVAARYEHILTNIDIRREAQLALIDESFDENHIVIVHGASGQGKSTLAYRYLHDFVPDSWCFQVRAIESRERALSVARALAGHANALGLPIVVFLDVSPGDDGWPELVRQLEAVGHIHVLVTIREEDWRRASLSWSNLRFGEIELAFDRSEARLIYDALSSRQVPERFINFGDAWDRFGGRGPLLEFVHLVTQGRALRDRLLEQVRRIEKEVDRGERDPAQLLLLRLVSTAGAFGARLQVARLVQEVRLRAPLLAFELLEKEYLVRLSNNGELVDGLHPVRSEILTDLLTEPAIAPWAEAARECLWCIYESDLELFLLCAFSRRSSDCDVLVDFLHDYQPETWVGVAGVLRALIWFGLDRYVGAQHDLIDELAEIAGPDGACIFLDFDVADAVPGVRDNIGELLRRTNPIERVLKVESILSRQIKKSEVFLFARGWLQGRTSRLISPISDDDWSCVAEVLFWSNHLGFKLNLELAISDVELDRALNDLPLGVLADVVFSITGDHNRTFGSWLENNRERILERFRHETQTVAVEDDGKIIKAHFIIESNDPVESEVSDKGDEDTLHDHALRRISLLRRLVPDREGYGCQGYGHRLLPDGLLSDIDSTQKTAVPKTMLPLLWQTSVNGTFRGLVRHHFRHASWPEYVDEVISIRKSIVRELQRLERVLEIYFRKSSPTQLIGEGRGIDEDTWQTCRRSLARLGMLPLCALDEWGFVDESSSAKSSEDPVAGLVAFGRHSLALNRYRPYLDGVKPYAISMSNFLQQALHVLALNPMLGRGAAARNSERRDLLVNYAGSIGIGENAGPLSTLNLADAVRALPTMQQEQRRLLSPFVDDQIFDQFERNEQKLFFRVWCAWHAFAIEPRQVVQQSTLTLPKRVSDLQKRMRNALKEELKRQSGDAFHLRILADGIQWENKPAMWLAIDVINPTEMFVALERVIESVRVAFGTIEPEGLRDHVIAFRWPQVVVMPLIRGKLQEQAAWRFYSATLVREEPHWTSHIQLPIPDEILQQLHLSRWYSPKLEVARTFFQSFVDLKLLTAHLRDIDRIPVSLDTLGTDLIQEYMQRTRPRLSQVLQSAFDRVGEMLLNVDQALSAFTPQDSRLIALAQQLQVVRAAVQPSQGFEREQLVSLQEIGSWAGRLEGASIAALESYLLWVTVVLDEVV